MPVSCGASGCANRRTIETRSRGITFHRFPNKEELRRQWEVAVRREGFSASDFTMLCSKHYFKPEHFDRTGQIVRIRDKSKPSIFSFPTHIQRPVAIRKTQASRKAEESCWSVDCSEDLQETEPLLPNAEAGITIQLQGSSRAFFALHASFDERYHLLTLKNNGGLMIPSEGTVKVVRSGERFIRQSPSGKAVKVSLISQFVRAEIGSEDVFLLGLSKD